MTADFGLTRYAGRNSHREAAMRIFFSTLLITALLAAGPIPALQFPRQAAHLTKSAGAPRYDARREAVVEGTVASVVTKPAPGMPSGARLLLDTPAGKIVAHLGDYALRGPNAVTLAPGDRVKVVGVMSLVGGHRLFLVRRLQSGLSVYRIRNEHGFLVRSAPADWRYRPYLGSGGRP
jgi:hypothetical protein